MCSRSRRIDRRTIRHETLVELRQPLGVDECLEDTKYFNHVFLATQSAHEAKIGDLVQMHVHLVDDSRLIAAIGQEDTNQLNDLAARLNQTGIATAGIEFCQFPAQE